LWNLRTHPVISSPSSLSPYLKGHSCEQGGMMAAPHFSTSARAHAFCPECGPWPASVLLLLYWHLQCCGSAKPGSMT
jgi:hypothetical protein